MLRRRSSWDSRDAAAGSRSTITLCAALVAGCAAAPQGGPEGDARAGGPGEGAWVARSTTCDASALLPGPVREKKVREGKVIARIAWGIDGDGSRYEIACFDMPEVLVDAEEDALLEMIEYRLGNTPGVRVTGRESAKVGELAAVELRLAVPTDRIGRYWIFLEGGRRLFEVSVVGPPGERLTEGAKKFFGSFRLEPRSSPTSAPAPAPASAPSR